MIWVGLSLCQNTFKSSCLSATTVLAEHVLYQAEFELSWFLAELILGRLSFGLYKLWAELDETKLILGRVSFGLRRFPASFKSTWPSEVLIFFRFGLS